jgi:predicted lipoprotein with Yx(FWY)xxD motif
MTRRLIPPLAGLAVAALVLAAAVAVAKSYTVSIAHGASVKDQSGTTKSESIVVNGRGFAVYTLTGDSKAHPKCTSSQCLQFWPPVTLHGKAKPSAQPGIHAKLSTWRHNGFVQVTLGGRPLYTYSGDTHRDAATGEGVMGFGGTWHVVTSGHAQSTTATTSVTATTSGRGTATTNPGTATTSTASTSTTSTGTPTVCANPPYCY